VPGREVLATDLRLGKIGGGVAGRLDDVTEKRKLVLQTSYLSRTMVPGSIFRIPDNGAWLNLPSACSGSAGPVQEKADAAIGSSQTVRGTMPALRLACDSFGMLLRRES
jgi:hypothetical protein